MNKSQKGFTLVELLVVVSIIGLLMGILLTSLGAAREQGRKVACSSNLRNLGFSIEMYINDNEGRLPSAEPRHRESISPLHWFMNSSLLANVNVTLQKDPNGSLIGPPTERTVLTCPSHRYPNMTRYEPGYPKEERGYALSYMMNGTWGLGGRPDHLDYRRTSEFHRPSESLVLCDGNGYERAPGIVLYHSCPKGNFEYRHRGSVNILFLDSHIESLTEKDIPFCSMFSKQRYGSFWSARKP